MNVLEAHNYKDYLSHELERRMQQNPNYSLRAFSRDLNLSPGELSEILRGKRKLSAKAAMKVSHSLGFSDVEKNHLILLTQSDSMIASENDQQDASYTKKMIDLEYFKVVEGWHHFAILNMVSCKGFKWNIKYIAKRLGLNTFEIKAAIDRLLKVNLIQRHKAKVYTLSDHVETPADVPSSSIKNYHRQVISKGVLALDEQQPDEREIRGAGFAIDPKSIPNIKKEIRDFQDKIIAKYSTGEKTEVYQLETLFFRITKTEEEL